MDIKKRYKKREIVQKTLIVQKTHFILYRVFFICMRVFSMCVFFL
jgi:hypothetical protein